MRIIDIILLSLRIFKTNLLRTILTFLGVGVGIAAIYFLVSLGYGLQSIAISNIANSDSMLTIDVLSGNSDIITLNNKYTEEIKKINHVATVSPQASIDGEISYNKRAGAIKILGAKSDYFKLQGIEIKTGALFKEDNSKGVIISTAVLDILAENDQDTSSIIGKKVNLKAFMKSSSGTEKSKDEEVSFKDVYTIEGVIDDVAQSYIYFPLETLQSQVTIDNYDILKVKVDSQENIESVKNEITNLGFNVSAVTDTLEEVNKIFKIVQLVLAVFGVIALVVAGIGMFNTMTISLIQRTNEIGIMKALGVSNGDILKMFLMEATIISFLGGVSGIILGELGAQIINYSINTLAKSFGGQAVDLFATPLWFIIFVLLFSTIVGFVTGFYPAIRAARINVLDALRYK